MGCDTFITWTYDLKKNVIVRDYRTKKHNQRYKKHADIIETCALPGTISSGAAGADIATCRAKDCTTFGVIIFFSKRYSLIRVHFVFPGKNFYKRDCLFSSSFFSVGLFVPIKQKNKENSKSTYSFFFHERQNLTGDTFRIPWKIMFKIHNLFALFSFLL